MATPRQRDLIARSAVMSDADRRETPVRVDCDRCGPMRRETAAGEAADHARLNPGHAIRTQVLISTTYLKPVLDDTKIG